MYILTSCENIHQNNMENLPVEVLGIVFHPLSKKKDIEKCFNTNSKWRHIIENMFTKKSNLDNFYEMYTVQSH